MDYNDFQQMAEMEAERMKLARQQQLAQSLMSGGYVPGSGRGGVLASILGSLAAA